MKFRGIRLMDRELIAAERMKAQFDSYDDSIRLESRVELLREWLLKELTALERKEREEAWVQDELDYLDREQYDESYRTLLSKYQREDAVFDFTQQYVDAYGELSGQEQGEENVFDFAARQEELLRRLVVKERFQPLRRDVKRFLFVDVVGLYGQLFGEASEYCRMTGLSEAPAHWPEICRQTKEKLARLELFHEDATPFLYVKELVEGVRKNTAVRQVFVDEGQDYSPFQYAFLQRLFPRARMTVLGDFDQAIFAQATNLHEEDSPLVRLYGKEETRLIRLVRSYRSTREIVAFTKSLLRGGGADIIPFERSGGKPWLVKRDSEEARAARIMQDLAALKAEGFESIAVITKTSAESREACEALTRQGGEALRLITKETLTFEKGISIIPAYLAKGVEFDAVLIYDASSRTYGRESERKLFYTACTRAMHRLRLYATGEWTPFLQGLAADLYEAGS